MNRLDIRISVNHPLPFERRLTTREIHSYVYYVDITPPAEPALNQN